VNNKYLQEAYQDAVKMQTELNSQRYKLEERKNVYQHTDLIAPVDGVVKYLRFNTIGAVLRGGDELMQIFPTNSDLIVEVKVNPADIGQLELGLPVSLRIDAFDSSIYGHLEGVVTYISSDTLTEQGAEGEEMALYRAYVTVNEEQTNPKIQKQQLKPGMTVTTDVLTGQRTVLSYLMKPVIKSFSGALSER
jgi:adhesin transport system membrane fusion protein